MKLTKETLKRIIKEEMMQVMHEMDYEQTNVLPEPLKTLQQRLEGIHGDFTNFEFTPDGNTLEVDFESTDENSDHRGSAKVTIGDNGKVIVDGNEMSIEQAVLDLNGDSKY